MAEKPNKQNEITESLLKKSKALKERYQATSAKFNELKARADRLLKVGKTRQNEENS